MGDDVKEKSQVKSMFDGNDRQVTRDCFYMTMVSLYQREPSHLISTNTDVDDYEITAIYDPSEKYGNLPIFSDFVIHHKKDKNFEIPLKEYKKRYMEFRNTILDMVTNQKEKKRKQDEQENRELRERPAAIDIQVNHLINKSKNNIKEN